MHRPRRILLVEDELAIAEGIRDLLHIYGYPMAQIASTGEEAIERVRQECPDVILMDIGLKGSIDGIDTAAIIRGIGGPRPIYITAHTDDGLLKRALDTDPIGYVVKPFPDRELCAAVEIGFRESTRGSEQAQSKFIQVMDGRLSSLSRLSAELNHHLNNHLTIIQGAASKIRNAEGDDHYRDKWLGHIERTVTRTHELIRSLDVGAFQSAANVSMLDLEKTFEKVKAEVSSAHPLGSRVLYSIAPDLKPVVGQSEALQNVFTQMIVNSCEALARVTDQRALRISVIAQNIEVGIKEAASSLQPLSPGRYVSVVISDNGVGISAENRQVLFEPFFTTKTDQVMSAGLNLWSAYWVVRGLGGYIFVDSEIGVGSKFTVLLPNS